MVNIKHTMAIGVPLVVWKFGRPIIDQLYLVKTNTLVGAQAYHDRQTSGPRRTSSGEDVVASQLGSSQKEQPDRGEALQEVQMRLARASFLSLASV